MLISQASLGSSRPSSSASSVLSTARRSVGPQVTTKEQPRRLSTTKPGQHESKLPSKPNPAVTRPKTSKPVVPVFMNAPYRTEPAAANPFRRSKSVAQLIDKPSLKPAVAANGQSSQKTEIDKKYEN